MLGCSLGECRADGGPSPARLRYRRNYNTPSARNNQFGEGMNMSKSFGRLAPHARRFALVLAARQAATSVGTSMMLALVLRAFG